MSKKRRKKKSAFYLVNTIRGPYDLITFDVFHVTMHQGVAFRDGKPCPAYELYRLPGHVNQWPPLKIAKNVYDMGDIIKPCSELVVSSEVKQILKGVKKIKFKEVEFEVLFNVPYELEDFSHWKKIKRTMLTDSMRRVNITRAWKMYRGNITSCVCIHIINLLASLKRQFV